MIILKCNSKVSKMGKGKLTMTLKLTALKQRGYYFVIILSVLIDTIQDFNKFNKFNIFNTTSINYYKLQDSLFMQLKMIRFMSCYNLV